MADGYPLVVSCLSLVINEPLLNDLRTICLEHSKDLRFSILLGTIEPERKEVTVLTAVHFRTTEGTTAKEQSIIPTKEELSEIQAFKYMLPFNLEVVGLAVYQLEEQSPTLLPEINRQIAESKFAQFLVTVGLVAINYYQITPTTPRTIAAQTRAFSPSNLLRFIYTLEFETAASVLESQESLKKALYDGIDLYWDEITFNKDAHSRLADLEREKRILDRVIEIQVPCEVKKLDSKTKEGNVFLALDLHINFLVTESLKSRALTEISKELNAAMKQDIMIKLQRAKYDRKIKRLITPQKIPLKFFGFELNGYLSKDNPSKYEYNLCLKLIDHAQLMAELGHTLKARLFLRDLIEYFQILGDQKVIERIMSLIQQMS